MWAIPTPAVVGGIAEWSPKLGVRTPALPPLAVGSGANYLNLKSLLGIGFLNCKMRIVIILLC